MSIKDDERIIKEANQEIDHAFSFGQEQGILEILIFRAFPIFYNF